MNQDIDLRCELIGIDGNNYVCKICGKVVDKNKLDDTDLNFCHQKLAMAAVRDDIPQIRLKSTNVENQQMSQDKSIYSQIWNNHPSTFKTNIKIDTNRPSAQEINNNRPKCTQEQIDARLSICHGCEFYKDNTCLKCGCALSREKNYMNKLFFADQKCPVDKWPAIIN